jgi:hypothetical protein
VGEVFAGFVCGYAVALIGAPLLGVALARNRGSSPLLARLLPEGTPVVPLVLVLHGGLILLCTGVGLILGMLLFAMRGAGEALGSPNIAFTLLVFSLTLAVSAPVIAVLARYRLQAVAVALTILVLFGWLMPYMARWSKFGSS